MLCDRLFAYSVDLLSVTDFDGVVKQVNPAWLQTLGRTEQELRGLPWTDLIDPQDVPTLVAVRPELTKERATFSMETRVRRKDGRYVWVS